jgi:hypothetical protein
MNPRQPSNDGFKPKWRHFHPQDVVWIKNPFDHDVIYQVADELNRPFQYKIPARATAELPGGAVATLGVKAIIDEMIQNAGSAEALRMHDAEVRASYEEKVIIKVRTAPTAKDASGPGGEINLGIKEKAVPKDTEPVDEVEDEFPGLTQPDSPDIEEIDDSVIVGQDEASKAVVSDIAGASLAGLPPAKELANAGE